MGFYSLSLSGSAYFAPVISGFIAEYAGWKWVFYVPAIWSAAVTVFLFFFMEETNYHRPYVGVVNAVENPSSSPPLSSTGSIHSGKGDEKKEPTTTTATNNMTATDESMPAITATKEKTFLQKMSIWQTCPGQNPFVRSIQILKYLGWPVIFYAGFSYGSYLIWFNVMNGTASIILGGAPYNFSSAMVGLSYLSCCLGVVAA